MSWNKLNSRHFLFLEALLLLIICSDKSIRLKGYDYRNSGAYFITICTNSPDFPMAENGVWETNGVIETKRAFFQTPPQMEDGAPTVVVKMWGDCIWSILGMLFVEL